MPPLTPQRKHLTNEEKLKIIEDSKTLGGTSETFSAIQHMEKTLFKSKVEESSKQTRITDAFPVKQIILK